VEIGKGRKERKGVWRVWVGWGGGGMIREGRSCTRWAGHVCVAGSVCMEEAKEEGCVWMVSACVAGGRGVGCTRHPLAGLRCDLRALLMCCVCWEEVGVWIEAAAACCRLLMQGNNRVAVCVHGCLVVLCLLGWLRRG
jgi:hypothetical protein